MNFDDILKLQILQSNTNNSQGINIIPIIIQFFIVFIMSITDEIKKLLPKIYNFYYEKYISKTIDNNIFDSKKDILDNAIKLNSKHNISKVFMTRIYEFPDNCNKDEYSNMNEIVDSILEYVASLNNIPVLEFIKNSSYLIMFKDNPIQITDDIYINICKVSKKDLCSFENIQITLISNTFTTKQIKDWINYIYTQYKINLENKLGDKIYYFEQYENKKVDLLSQEFIKKNCFSEKMVKNALLQQEPKFLTFHLQEFHSNKYFSNLYGKIAKTVYEKINIFEKNPEFYINKGLPRHLGILLYGQPGLGKTAIIKCIANETKRHIINVNFKNIKTISQFRNLFSHNDISTVSDINNGVFKKITIPMEKRLYVLEEIDAISDIVKQRTSVNDKEYCDEELTLGEILTELDGTLEKPGRMIIITSNHPENIDSALLRPGRIDLIVKFEKIDKEETIEMIEKFLDIKIEKEYYNSIPSKKISFAELQQILLKYIDTEKTKIETKLIIEEINNFKSTKEIFLDYTKKNNEIDKDVKNEIILPTKVENYTQTSNDEFLENYELIKSKNKQKENEEYFKNNVKPFNNEDIENYQLLESKNNINLFNKEGFPMTNRLF